MTQSDDALQGIFIGSLSLVTLITIAYCLKKRFKKYSMKKSASAEDLNSVDTVDPTQIQDEERYALPPILVTIASQRKE